MAKNEIQTWQQGQFVDQVKYTSMGDLWKDEKRKEEAHLVRPGLTENAICWCPHPDDAAWIAQRLNLAAQLEQMTYDYATGKTDGSEIVSMVRDAVA
ncbi:hypothetical protein [Phaeobacter inhibens]|uniref:hypothetical protein n=1 Tax=Phaeobacter inhibens TaxID=221822 RepID=UPI0001632C93|nr:hypothetical protein [Phaeobacter inhibens]AFO91563.1 hypothetical protein PGA1_c18660 [Phaeobacter inhibens DSM 17395]AUQ46231.1 hypothetical protein PhaeoP10_01893 [Phaeobacter inhibens]